MSDDEEAEDDEDSPDVDAAGEMSDDSEPERKPAPKTKSKATAAAKPADTSAREKKAKAAQAALPAEDVFDFGDDGEASEGDFAGMDAVAADHESDGGAVSESDREQEEEVQIEAAKPAVGEHEWPPAFVCVDCLL
jgi:hypothetical protein